MTPAIATYVPQPRRLEVYEDLNAPDERIPLYSEVLPVPPTAVAVVPFGVAWVDQRGLLHIHRLDLVEPAQSDKEPAAASSVWVGSRVTCMVWLRPDMLITGDDDGRLMLWSPPASSAEPWPAPLLIMHTAAPWRGLWSSAGGCIVAITAHGQAVWLDDQSRVTRTAKAPGPTGRNPRLGVWETRSCLIYHTASPITSGVLKQDEPPHGTQGGSWMAWCWESQQPISLPSALRYADAILAIPDGLLAMSAQGTSWRWLGLGTDPVPIDDWPAGPFAEVVLLNNTPTILRLDVDGGLHVLKLRDHSWVPSMQPWPGPATHRVWAGSCDAFDNERSERRRRRASALKQCVIEAHADGDIALRDDTLKQLLHVGAKPVVIHALRAKFAEGEKDYPEALSHSLQLMADPVGQLDPAAVKFHTRQLWRVAACDELSALAAKAIRLTGLPKSLAPDRFFKDKQLGTPLLDTQAHNPPADCPWHETARARLEHWGSVGAIWLTVRREQPQHLMHPVDWSLLQSALGYIDAQPREMIVLDPDGTTHERKGWVIAERLDPDGSMERQLVVWLRPGTGIQLEPYWSLCAHTAAPAETWRAGWQAVCDPNWQAGVMRGLKNVLEAVACGIDPASVQEIST